MKVLSMQEFLDEPDIEYARIPGFRSDTSIVIGSLSAGDLIEWSEANEGEAKRNAGLRLIAKSLVDGNPDEDEGAKGVRISSDKDLGKLRAKSHKVTERIVKAILKLNGMTVKGDADAKNV